MEGWMYKKRTKGLPPHIFQRRWAVIPPGAGGTLTYSKAAGGEVDKARGGIACNTIERMYPATDAEVGKSSIAKRCAGTGLSVCTEARTYVLLFDSMDERDAWVRAIWAAADHSTCKLHPMLQAALHSTRSAARPIVSALAAPAPSAGVGARAAGGARSSVAAGGTASRGDAFDSTFGSINSTVSSMPGNSYTGGRGGVGGGSSSFDSSAVRAASPGNPFGSPVTSGAGATVVGQRAASVGNPFATVPPAALVTTVAPVVPIPNKSTGNPFAREDDHAAYPSHSPRVNARAGAPSSAPPFLAVVPAREESAELPFGFLQKQGPTEGRAGNKPRPSKGAAMPPLDDTYVSLAGGDRSEDEEQEASASSGCACCTIM